MIGICTQVTSPFAWELKFPPVYGHTSISYLKHCPGFELAKRGDINAALNVVNMCVKPGRISELKNKYTEAVLLPVITANRLPEVFAHHIGMMVHTGVSISQEQKRKTLSAMERLLCKPSFCGKINKGTNYIIVDDVVTQGGTISSLRKFVIFNGGTISAVTALAFSTDSRIIAPDLKDVHAIINKFNIALLNSILREYNIADDVRELTRSQIRYLLSFKEVENIISSMAKTSKTMNVI